jgi:hypothetical protein
LNGDIRELAGVAGGKEELRAAAEAEAAAEQIARPGIGSRLGEVEAARVAASAAMVPAQEAVDRLKSLVPTRRSLYIKRAQLDGLRTNLQADVSSSATRKAALEAQIAGILTDPDFSSGFNPVQLDNYTRGVTELAQWDTVIALDVAAIPAVEAQIAAIDDKIKAVEIELGAHVEA